MPRDFDPNEPEQMDRPQPVTPELERDLDNLQSLNRWFGSHRIVRQFLELWWERGGNYRVLDLATGAGDIPRLIADWAQERGVTVQIDAVDASPATLEIARARSRGYREIRWVQGDARTFNDGRSYDLVCCSLALHHFSEDDAVRLLRHCRRMSHHWTLVTDLERSPWTQAGVWLVTELLYPEPMTKHDGRLSARRAFSFGEMRALAEEADWTDFGHARFLFCRQALWLAQHDAGEVRDLAAVVPVPVPEGLPCPT